MPTNQDTGLTGENLAADYLLNKGYAIKARNYRAGRYELDIVALENNTLIIVEVKTRHSSTYGNPDEAVTRKKLQQLAKATSAYLEEHNLELEVRYDIVSITLGTTEPLIEHFMDVYIPYDLDLEN